MKNILESSYKIAIFCSLILTLFPFKSYAQQNEFDKQVAQKLSTLDLSDLKTNFLLNKGIFTTDEIDEFRKKPRNRYGQIVMYTTAEGWENLYERLIGADMRGNGRIPNFQQFAEKDRLKQTKNNVIPIGIMNADVTLMSTTQIDENTKLKGNKQKVVADKYEKLYIVSAAVLQEDIYQANVKFRLSSALQLGTSKSEIRSVSIDFQDGKGYKDYKLNEQSIDYTFTSVGERNIGIRLNTERGNYLFYSKINVRQLERPKVHREFEISANPIREDTITKKKNGRTAINIVGGNVRIILSCDGVFDKPIVIGEGFDIGQDVGLDEIAYNYLGPLRFLVDGGYDLVLLDYWDARAPIENNAQVMKSLIREVNNTKIGSEKLVVIGESMSGLVARWALREMEINGENHNTRVYISFDSPHQGANVPPSITNIYWVANPTLLANVIYPILPKSLRNTYEAMQTPAAAQMLMHYFGRPFIGQPHPEFSAFRNRLQALGNGGYPSQCRNIAITNGSIDGSDRSLFNSFSYGSNILTSITPYPLQNTYIEAYTNRVNQNSIILNFATTGILSNSLANLSYSSQFNDDFLPGGLSSFAVPNKLTGKVSKEFRFCFVPTFSSIDYQGDRSNQNSREYLDVMNTTQKPFAAIYGNFNQFRNRNHVNARATNWNQLAQNEGFVLQNIYCLGRPITPYFYSNLAIDDCLPVNQNITYTVAPTGDLSQYTHQWELQPSGIQGTGNSFTVNTSQLVAGTKYTLVCTRRYLNNYSSFTSWSISLSLCDVVGSEGSPCTFNEGEFVYLLSNGENVFAHFQNSTLYATTSNGTFISRTTLVNNGLPSNFANCFAENDPRGGTSSTSCPSGNFAGFLDYSNCSNFGGWALDHNNYGRTVDVDIFIDGNKVATVQANQNRPDLAQAFGNPAAAPHGWTYNVPANAPWRNSQNHTASARICGANSNLWSDKTVNCTGGSNCNPPNPPNISANPSTINSGGNSTLTASNCGGTVNWSNGINGNSVSVNPSATTNYTATCSQSGCTSGNSNTATVTVNSGGGGGGGGCVVNRVRLQFRFPSDCCFDRLLGAKIQGSNDGNSWNDLYTFSQNGTGTWQDFNFENSTAYQQVRFQASNTGWGELAEIEYYNGNTRLNGTSFGVGNYALAYDGNTGTKWETNSEGTSNVTGLVLTGCSGGGGGCTPPNAPNISANPSSINSGGSSTLTASGCGGGTVNWSNSASGNSVSVNPSATTNYTATCTISCSSGNSNTATVTVNSGGGGSSACSPENIQCSSNQYETRDYMVNASNSGNYTTTVFYRSHEGAGQIRWQVNGGAVQTMNVAQTGINDYPQITLGSASLNAGNNTITLSSGSLFLCFKQVCIQSGARIGLVETLQPDNDDLVISPNPTDGILNLKLWLSEASAVNVEVQDLTGRGVKTNNFSQQVGQFNETINLSDLPSGMYLLQLRTDKRCFAKKLMVVR